MATKEVTLTVSERVAAAKILNDFKGNLTTLSTLLDDMKKIVITDEEWEKAELKKTLLKGEDGTPNGQETWNWQDKPENDKVIDLQDTTVTYLNGEIKKKEDANEITMADVALVTLKAKIF